MMQKAALKTKPPAFTRTPQRRSRSVTEREQDLSVIVGQNIRTLRTMAGMSQSALAEKLGLTFQQVQKYEKGLNRIGAPKLVLLAELFKTPITTFFSNTGLSVPQDSQMPSFSKDGMRAARIIDTLSPKMRGPAIRVLQSLQSDEG